MKIIISKTLAKEIEAAQAEIAITMLKDVAPASEIAKVLRDNTNIMDKYIENVGDKYKHINAKDTENDYEIEISDEAIKWMYKGYTKVAPALNFILKGMDMLLKTNEFLQKEFKTFIMEKREASPVEETSKEKSEE